MLHRVVLVRTDVSEEGSASIIRETKIRVLGMLVVPINWRKLQRNTVSFFAATRRIIPEDGSPYNHHSENLKSYVMYSCDSKHHAHFAQHEVSYYKTNKLRGL
jgi:hypothetical protein